MAIAITATGATGTPAADGHGKLLETSPQPPIDLQDP